MPTYQYTCTHCGEQTEIFQKITEAAISKCPKCLKETLRRGPGGGIGLSFTGTGFYSTDYGPRKEESSTSSTCCPCGKNQSCS